MENTKFSNDTKVFIKDKYNYIDKIEEFFVIIDQTEFQDKIYRNSINIQNNLEVFKKLLYDNFELSQKDTTILLHCLKFVDMLNLFMNKNILNKVFELIRDINDQIAIIPNYESKDEILKKIKYTEKSVIYYKKKHFKLLFFKDDETIYKEFEELFSNSSEARNFRQLQNCFYIFSQKINEEKRLLIQNKINLIKDKKVKNHNGNTYNNYQNTQNFGYNNYYSSYYGYSYPNYNYNSANRVFNHEEEFVVHDKNRNNDTKIDTVNKFIELPPSIDDSNKTIKSPEPVEEKIYPIKENINYNNGNNYSMPGTNSNNSYYNKKFYNNNYINNYNSYGNNNYNYKNYYNYNNNYVSVNKNTNVFIDKGNLNEKESNNEGENKIKKTSQNEKLIQIVNGHKKEAKANSGKNISSSIFDNKGNNSKDEKIKFSQDDYSNKIENNKENIEVIESNKNGDINENIIRDNNNYNSYNNINNENFYNSNKMYPSFQNNKNKYYTNNYNNRLKNYQYNTNENYNYTNNNYYKYINQNNNENTDLNQNNPNLLNNKNNKQKTFYKNYEMNEQINNTCLKKSCEKTNGNVNDSIFTTSPEFHSKENKPSSFENLNLETKSQSCNQLENNNTFLHLNIDQMFEIDKMNNAIKKEEENNKNEKDDYEDNDPEDFLNQSINSQNFNQMEDNIKEYLKNNPDIANDIKNNTSGDDNEEEDESSSDQEEEIEGKQINNLPKNNKIIFSDDANDIVINNIGKNNTFNDKLNDEDIKKPNEEHNDLINNIINNDKNYETTEKIKINLNSEVFLSKSLRNNSELKNDDTNNNYIFQENNMMSSTPYNQNLSNYHDYFMSNYAHFFFRGRDSSIHREYFALKCLEQQKPFLISNHLNDFENKILVPLYQRINITMYKKKKLYYYTYTKYRNIIYKVLYDDKVLSKVEPYGSYVNNFLIDSGDIDICIVPKCSFIEFNIYLERIKDFVIENKIGDCQMTHTNNRYMLIKIVDNETKFVIDITVHNLLPILNTKLIYLYSILDQRFHLIGIYLKYWAKMNKLHGAADNYLSSYALLLMLIHFFQKVVEPKILPNLQKIELKEKFYEYNQNANVIKTNIYFAKDLQKIKKHMKVENNGQMNTETASTLLVKFFEYYSYYFDFFSQRVSIHKEINESIKALNDNSAFSIEDPFDLTHNPGKSMTLNSSQFNKFLTAMKKEINYILNGEYLKRIDLISKK